MRSITFDDVKAAVLQDDVGKKDVIEKVKNVSMMSDGTFKIGSKTYSLSPNAFNQLMARVEIPVKYGRKCPGFLLAPQVNYWRDSLDPETPWLFRIKDDVIRAVVTAEYSILDNRDIVKAIERDLELSKTNHEVTHFHISDDRGFHLRILLPGVEEDFSLLRSQVTDKIQGGFYITNSEVGKGSAGVEFLLLRLICTNGLVGLRGGEGFRNVHRGDRSIETFNRKFSNLLNGAEGRLKTLLKRYSESRYDVIQRAHELAEYFARGANLSETMIEEVRKQLEIQRIRTTDYTRYDLINAFTAAARIEEADKRAEVEAIGGRIADMSLSEIERVLHFIDLKKEESALR